MHIHGHYAVAILQEREPILNNPSQPKPIQDILAMLFKPALSVKTMERMLAKAKSVDDFEKIMSDVDEFGSKMRKYLGAAANIKKVAREKARSMQRTALRESVDRGKQTAKKAVYRGRKKKILWPGKCLACVYRWCQLEGGPKHEEKLCGLTQTWLSGRGGAEVKAYYKK